MISKTITSTKTERDFEPFPEHPPRDDMQNWIHLNRDGKGAALVTHIGDRETTTTGSEVPVGPTLANRRDHRIPDFMVSKNSKPWLIEQDGGYAIDRQGKRKLYAYSDRGYSRAAGGVRESRARSGGPS